MPYIPGIIDTESVRTLWEWGRFFKDNGQPVDIIELMAQELTILDDIPWKEATHLDGNHTVLRVELPKVAWGRLYKGTDASKSAITMVKDPVAMLEGRSIIDARLLKIHGSQARSYRAGEAKAFMESLRQKLATAIFYGNVAGNPDGIHGFDPRYAYSNAPNVINAGGTGSECTSIWGVVWGENETMGIFPKDSPAGVSHRDLGEDDAYDPNGKPFRAVSDLYEWNVGLSVRDWRCVFRICNIPVASLMLKKGDAGFIDLHRLTIRAKNLLPPEKLPRLKWYCNRDVMTALELQASDAGNVTLVYRKEDARRAGPLFKSYIVEDLHGCPLRQNDCILSTEEALKAMP
jgi:hypothetical protein